MQALNEERTAHHVRRLHGAIRDLQNALGVFAKSTRTTRPPSHALTPDTPATENPYSRITANNERGVIQRIERIQDVGVAVLGLNGIGALVADSLSRYGVKRLVVGDNTEISAGDMGFSNYYVHDIGKKRDDHIAATTRRLNPEVDVFSLGIPLSDASYVTEVLKEILLDDDDEEDNNEGSTVESDASSGSSDSDSDHWDSDNGAAVVRQLSTRRRVVATDDDMTDWDELCFDAVLLCGTHPDLAMRLNDLCCEFGVQLVYVMMGKNGMSGEVLSVVPGRSACLQCMEKQKILKIHSHVLSEPAETDNKPLYEVGLPSTECVLAGIAVQHVLANSIGAGPICSRVEYDGYLEELDRSGFIAPVHQCPSQFCRDRQQQR